MDSENNIFEKFGGRKFLLTLVSMVAIITIAIVQPTTLSTELIVGLLGAIATYAGSNAFLTSFALKTKSPVDPNISRTQINDAGITNYVQYPDRPEELMAQVSAELSNSIQELQSRMAQNEKTTSEVIDIIKQLMSKK